MWASPALPVASHDLTAARAHGLIDALTAANVVTFADKGYQGVEATAIVQAILVLHATGVDRDSR